MGNTGWADMPMFGFEVVIYLAIGMALLGSWVRTRLEDRRSGARARRQAGKRAHEERLSRVRRPQGTKKPGT